MEGRWAELILNGSGDFRIGTIKDFRKEEKYGKIIGDQGEGRLIQNYNQRNEPISHTPHFFQKGIIIDNCKNIDFRNNSVQTKHDFGNCFVYSLCTIYNENIHSELKEKNNYDYCLEIIDTEKFVKYLTFQFKKISEVYFVGSSVTHIGERYTEKDISKHPAFLKTLEYSDLSEYRIVWSPTNENSKIEPIFVNSYYLRSLIKLHKKI